MKFINKSVINCFFLSLCFVFAVHLFQPVNVFARNSHNFLDNFTPIYSLDRNSSDQNSRPSDATANNKPSVNKDELKEDLDNYNKPQTCTGDNSILGSYNDPDSVAWLLKKIFNWVKLLGPFIVLVMSSIDYSKVLLNGDDEEMKKAQKKLIVRLILAGALFLLPDLLKVVLNLFNITSNGICGLE